jgi:hypothetical protein
VAATAPVAARQRGVERSALLQDPEGLAVDVERRIALGVDEVPLQREVQERAVDLPGDDQLAVLAEQPVRGLAGRPPQDAVARRVRKFGQACRFARFAARSSLRTLREGCQNSVLVLNPSLTPFRVLRSS